MYEWDSETEELAGDIVTYEDDVRATGKGPKCLWRVLGWFETCLEAETLTQTPGARAGSVVRVMKEELARTCYPEEMDTMQFMA